MLIEIKDVTFTQTDKEILSNVNLIIQPEKVTALIGPSGCGKTTILKLISGQLTPDSGVILLDGQDINKLSHYGLCKLRQQMGVLFQSSALFTDLTVFENVAFPIREHTDLPENMVRDLVLIKLNAVGLRGAHDLMPYALSGGMARRVALARSIALDPAIIMYDEPFTGQDPISMGVLIKLIKNLNLSLKLTTILVSHDVQETMGISDYIYVILNRTIIAHGSPQDITNSKDQLVQQFINGLPDGPVPFHYKSKSYGEDLGILNVHG